MIGCRSFTDKEIQDISDMMTNLRDRTWFLLGVNTGFRISELLSFRVKTVMKFNTIADEITVERSVMKRKREGRSIALNGDAKKILKKYLKELKKRGAITPDTFLFQSAKGENKPITRMHADHVLREACKKLKITGDIATHSMRKTYAMQMYKITGDIYKVQQALGHADIGSTLKYLPKDREAVNSAVQQISYGVKI